MYGYQPNFKMLLYTMSDHYFKAARDAGCIGLHTGMTGFHACAADNNCFKPKIGKTSKKATSKSKKVKSKKARPVIIEELDALPISEGRSLRSGKKIGMGMNGGCGSCSPWITHVKAYQHKHGCSYKIALSEASKTYHK